MEEKLSMKILTCPVMAYFNYGDTPNCPIWALTLDVSIEEHVPHN
jgi:hypothetical protein